MVRFWGVGVYLGAFLGFGGVANVLVHKVTVELDFAVLLCVVLLHISVIREMFGSVVQRYFCGCICI